MRLVPVFDRHGTVKAWADPDSSWLCDPNGLVFALVSFDQIFNRAGTSVGWWCGDYLREHRGKVVGFLHGAAVPGLSLPTLRRLPQAPKLRRPSKPPALYRKAGPMPKTPHWADSEMLKTLNVRLHTYFRRAYDLADLLAKTDDELEREYIRSWEPEK